MVVEVADGENHGVAAIIKNRRLRINVDDNIVGGSGSLSRRTAKAWTRRIKKHRRRDVRAACFLLRRARWRVIKTKLHVFRRYGYSGRRW